MLLLSNVSKFTEKVLIRKKIIITKNKQQRNAIKYQVNRSPIRKKIISTKNKLCYLQKLSAIVTLSRFKFTPYQL